MSRVKTVAVYEKKKELKKKGTLKCTQGLMHAVCSIKTSTDVLSNRLQNQVSLVHKVIGAEKYTLI